MPSDMFLPLMNAVWCLEIIFSITLPSLLAIALSKIYMVKLIRLIGLNSLAIRGASNLGINALKEELSPLGREHVL